jgi:hypothetical protein
MPSTKHAVYATTPVMRDGTRVTFRVGQPVHQDRADARWMRLDNRKGGWEGVDRRPVTVKHDGRSYPVEHLEVRATDTHGRGLGAARHATALTVPYRALRSAKS